MATVKGALHWNDSGLPVSMWMSLYDDRLFGRVQNRHRTRLSSDVVVRPNLSEANWELYLLKRFCIFRKVSQCRESSRFHAVFYTFCGGEYVWRQFSTRAITRRIPYAFWTENMSSCLGKDKTCRLIWTYLFLRVYSVTPGSIHTGPGLVYCW